MIFDYAPYRAVAEASDMVDFDDLGLNDEPMEIAHEFEVDLNCVVIVNHNFTLDGITRAEDEEVSKFRMEDEGERSLVSYIESFYQDLRCAASNLALVGLVTRLQHWISRYAKEFPSKKKDDNPSLIKGLRLLNQCLGEGPVSITFFQELVNLRDSVIHADSKAEWEYPVGTPRRVAECYKDFYGGIKLDEDQLKEALANSIR